MRKLKVFGFIVLSLNALFASAQYNIKNFGATGDGTALETRFIQQAIDEAVKNKGGTVDIPAGIYKIGTLILKDNIELHLQPGAVLLGSPDYKDYTEVTQQQESRTKNLYAKYFMLFAEGARNISITGSGIINGNGRDNFGTVNPQNLRPFLMRLVHCSNVIIRDVKLLESANWTLHLLNCKDVNIDGIVIENSGHGNRDGLDIDACQRVAVSNSRFVTTDDAIVMKSSNDTLCQDIAITNCFMRTTGSAIKTGTESNGGFRNITVSNCVVKDIPRHAGIELMTVDGGILQNVLLENIIMENVNTPIFIRIGLRARPYQKNQYVSKIGDVRDICMNNISVTNAKLPSSIMGLHSKKIKNISINNYTVRYNATQEMSAYNEVPFEEFSYPMAVMFRNLPAYGFYCRNVEDLSFQNIRMYSVNDEKRPALTFDRVENLQLFSVKTAVKTIETPMIHFRNSKNINASFCGSLDKSNVLFETESNTVTGLNCYNNTLFAAQKEVVKSKAFNDKTAFEDLRTQSCYTVTKGTGISGIMAHDLSLQPLKADLDILKKGHAALMLLMLNTSSEPQTVKVKYDGIEQEFAVSWNQWGWVPLTLIKQFENGQKVNFEIMADHKDAGLQIAKLCLIYQDPGITD